MYFENIFIITFIICKISEQKKMLVDKVCQVFTKYVQNEQLVRVSSVV